MRWKLDLLLWPRDQETESPVEACWLSQTQEGQMEQIHPQNFDDPFFWQHWHDLHALVSHWIDSQQGILCWGFKRVQEEIPSEETIPLQIGLVAIFTRTMHQSTTPSLLQTIWPRWASRHFLTLAPYDFWLFPKLKGCRCETIEVMKEAVTKVIDTLTQEDFYGAFQKFFGTVQEVHCSRKRLLRRGLEFHECTINKSAHTKKVWKPI